MPLLLGVVARNSVLVLHVEVTNLVAFDGEGQPPIAADRDAPCSGAVAFQLMDAPPRRATDLGHVLGDEEHGENMAQPLDQIRGKLSGVVVFDEAQKPAMLNAPNLHLGNVRLDRTGVKEKRSEERPASVENNLVDPFRRPLADGAGTGQLTAVNLCNLQTFSAPSAALICRFRIG